MVFYAGRIVNVCSMAAHIASPKVLPYCMSKTATFVMSNGLRRELNSFGVKVATISPWFVYSVCTWQRHTTLDGKTLSFFDGFLGLHWFSGMPSFLLKVLQYKYCG